MSEIHRPVSETKHFSTGSTCPDVKPGLLRLYSMKFCPFAQRTRLILAAKRIPHEVVNINLITKPEWYFAKNPLGKVPCLEFEGNLVYESLITADYLDDVYPERSLNNKDPLIKAQDRMLIELFNKVTTNLYGLYGSISNPEGAQEKLKNMEDGLAVFENELDKRSTSFFGGSKPGMLDYMIWPWIERIPAISVLNNALNIEKNKFPKLMSWCDAMEEDAAVKESYISPENHALFLTSHFAGKPDYDMEV